MLSVVLLSVFYAVYRYAECHCAAKKHVKRRFVKKNHNFDKNEFGHTLMCSLSLTSTNRGGFFFKQPSDQNQS